MLLADKTSSFKMRASTSNSGSVTCHFAFSTSFRPEESILHPMGPDSTLERWKAAKRRPRCHRALAHFRRIAITFRIIGFGISTHPASTKSGRLRLFRPGKV